jgi:hypothetical protein
VKALLFSFALAVSVFGCGKEPDPFAMLPENRWAVEETLRELQPELTLLEAAILQGDRATASLRAFLAEGAPAVARGLGRFERFEVHVEAAVPSKEGQGLELLLSYEGILAGAGAGIASIVGESHLSWERVEGSGAWRLMKWAPRWEKTQSAPAVLFKEVLALRTEEPVTASLRRSLHEEKVSQHLLTGAIDGGEHRLEYEAFDRHPGLAVADVDGNGWEDIYLVARWGPNQLLLNQSGHFEEAAAEWGLDLVDHSTSAVFADLDNDGDPDLVLGGSLKRSQILVNHNGRFVALPESAAPALPKLVSSVSVVDVDSDGLLDIYFSTYAASMVERIRDFGGALSQGALALEGFVGADEASLLAEQIASEDFHFYLDRPGPRNRLLRNKGGLVFEEVLLPESLGLMRNTYQAAWSDVDLDGDQDVYLANDFAPNTLFRNEGDWVFSDMTQEMGVADFGFGMGVGWGDYDQDGRFDLYVSNMYSRAGRRMTSGVEGMDPRIQKAARGNSLFRNTPDGFLRVSGLEKGLQVERAGWAWGGQFLDINNDGLEDLYVLNGYYSAPPEAALDRDT